MGNIIFKKVQCDQVSCDFNAPNGFVANALFCKLSVWSVDHRIWGLLSLFSRRVFDVFLN